MNADDSSGLVPSMAPRTEQGAQHQHKKGGPMVHNHLEPQSAGTSPFDTIKRTRSDDSEYWSARDLMPMLGYDNWQNFSAALDRAKIAAEVQGHNVENLFTGISKKGAGRPQQDYELARFACYLTAMNGDPRKPEIAAAMAYFAIQTHVAETQTSAPQELSRKQILTMALEAEDRAEIEKRRADEQEQLAGQRMRAIESQAPAVSKAAAHSASKEWKGRQEFAREVQNWGRQWGYSILQESVHELLRRKGMLVSGNRRDRNHATAHAEKSGWAKTEKGVSEITNKPWAAARISPKGQDLAWKWINKAAEEYGAELNPMKENTAA